jgi:hypothetical protein
VDQWNCDVWQLQLEMGMVKFVIEISEVLMLIATIFDSILIILW